VGAGKSSNGRGKKSGQEKSSHIARHHYQREFPTIATTFTTENLAEILSDVLKDILPHDLNRSEDEEGSSSASEVEPEPEPEPKKLKTIKEMQKNRKSHKSQKKKKMDAVTMSNSNVEFLGALSKYSIHNDTCSPMLRGRNFMRMTSTRMQKSCRMASRTPGLLRQP